ncbi:MAG: DUF1345 domain-containing protein, partial [Bradyrhizobium sp.]|nr:DUF1345 domain-containing protein [Bradyrhizobium sp.]
VLRIVRARPRLFLSAVLGALIIVLLPATMKLATRLLICWDCGVGLYLGLALSMMARCEIAHIRRRARLQDEGQTAILVLTVAAALASIGAIVAELGTHAAATGRQPAELILATLTIVLSWGFIHVIFALHYGASGHRISESGCGATTSR